MHRSRLGGVIIDCRTEDIDGAAEFWSQALGLDLVQTTDPRDKNYIRLRTASNDLDIEVQKVDHPSRVHIDIETDDVVAEVRRLEALGAERIVEIRDWVVMQAPTGHRFCVVPVQRSGFASEANRWN
ncbi:MAG TPA: VOC family protein [Alphaproteobacteria bacterium]|nr:VOC family protein [Alphaproteobacteria bacterium]